MSYGNLTETPCPVCGHGLAIIDYTQDPPPIPPPPRGGYEGLNQWLEQDGDGVEIFDCPSCETELPPAALMGATA